MGIWPGIVGLTVACGSTDFYAACEAAAQCESLVPESATAQCVEKEQGGFCTWSCQSALDCAGDADDEWEFTCAPFESSPGLYCFPHCNQEVSDNLACPEGYGCRSTGGGADNERICFPL